MSYDSRKQGLRTFSPMIDVSWHLSNSSVPTKEKTTVSLASEVLISHSMLAKHLHFKLLNRLADLQNPNIFCKPQLYWQNSA